MKLKIDNIEVTPMPDESLYDIVKRLGLSTGRLSEDPIAAKIAGRVFTLNYIPLRMKDIGVERGSVRKAIAASDGIVRLLTYRDIAGRDVYKRTAQFILFLAIRRLWPTASAKMSCTVGSGLYVKVSGADDFVTRLPDGYNTMLTGNGANLSQGQRQLIAIARAAVADPPVMILDEATSSIDTRTEQIVQRGMDALMRGRTVFVIAHRLSTVQNSDVIMVLDHGVIIERGSHEELIEKKGQYYRLYTGAFELE